MIHHFVSTSSALRIKNLSQLDRRSQDQQTDLRKRRFEGNELAERSSLTVTELIKKADMFMTRNDCPACEMGASSAVDTGSVRLTATIKTDKEAKDILHRPPHRHDPIKRPQKGGGPATMVQGAETPSFPSKSETGRQRRLSTKTKGSCRSLSTISILGMENIIFYERTGGTLAGKASITIRDSLVAGVLGGSEGHLVGATTSLACSVRVWPGHNSKVVFSDGIHSFTSASTLRFPRQCSCHLSSPHAETQIPASVLTQIQLHHSLQCHLPCFVSHPHY